MKKNTSPSGFSIALAMGLTLLLSFVGLYVIEYMVPFSQNIKGVENASQSFYEAYSGIEDSLLIQSKNHIGYETGSTFTGIGQEYKYTLIGTGTLSPRSGEGTSEYNKNYNKLSSLQAAQFLIGNARLSPIASASLQLFLQVPDINKASLDELDITPSNDPIVLWQLSSTGSSLSATGTYLISESEINIAAYNLPLTSSLLAVGESLNGSSMTFSAFYTANCFTGRECVLKISIINPLESTLTGSPKIPYLEYKLQSNRTIPLRESVIISDGKSYGFSKKLEVSVPQLTTNSAFDFTVFQ